MTSSPSIAVDVEPFRDLESSPNGSLHNARDKAVDSGTDECRSRRRSAEGKDKPIEKQDTQHDPWSIPESADTGPSWSGQCVYVMCDSMACESDI